MTIASTMQAISASRSPASCRACTSNSCDGKSALSNSSRLKAHCQLALDEHLGGGRDTPTLLKCSISSSLSVTSTACVSFISFSMLELIVALAVAIRAEGEYAARQHLVFEEGEVLGVRRRRQVEHVPAVERRAVTVELKVVQVSRDRFTLLFAFDSDCACGSVVAKSFSKGKVSVLWCSLLPARPVPSGLNLAKI